MTTHDNARGLTPEQQLARVRAALHPNSLESRMDAAVRCDSEVVRHLRRLLGVPATPEQAQLDRDQEHGDERRGQ